DGVFPASHPEYAAQEKAFHRIARTPGLLMRMGHLQEQKQKWQYPLRKSLEAYGVDMADFQAKTHFEFRKKYEQKGVDTLIVLDLVRLAQRRAYDIAVLICGDRDVAEAVRVAQDEGRRIIIAHPRGAGVSRELQHVADEMIELDQAALQTLLVVPPASSPA